MENRGKFFCDVMMWMGWLRPILPRLSRESAVDQATRLRLNQINREFYARTADEFDATRARAWPGWIQVLSEIELPIDSIIDIGCGNGRFAHFLAVNQQEPFVYTGIDSNRQLLGFARARLSHVEHMRLGLIECDLVQDEMPDMRAQLLVLFGVLHHVPGFQGRKELLVRCAELVSPGGFLVFAAWRFYEEERFRSRIVPWDCDIQVEMNDYLLDWRRGERAVRYCHYVDDVEHDELVAVTGLSSVADFRADGASGTLNRYSVLKKKTEG